MDVFVTYQEDTVLVKSLINILPQTSESGNLDIRREPVSVIEIPERKPPGDSGQVKKTYTPEQIRYWRLQQEKKLLVNDSKYIQPKNEIAVNSTELGGDNNIILPIRVKQQKNTDWLTIILLFGVILFATVRYFYTKYVGHLFLSLINYSTSARMFQERNYPVSHPAFRLEAIFYITFSLFIFQALNVIKWENAYFKFTYFAMVFGAVMAYFFGKKFLYLILGSVFETTSETSEFLFNINNFNRTLGIILLPTVALISFYPSGNPLFIVYAGIAIVLGFYAVLILRGILILLKKQFSILYLFLYLCTLEFLPLLLIYKVVVDK
ncbi:MAG: DUF4271 domain-containing protein [Bacteroidota bacterium]